MISLGSDRTTSSLQGSEITCESDRWIPMFTYPASWHTPLPPCMACECLGAMDPAFSGSGVKAKASLFFRQVGQTGYIHGNAAEAPRGTDSNAQRFPSRLAPFWTHAKNPRNFLFIFFLFTHKSWSNPSLPEPDMERISSPTRHMSRQLKHKQKDHKGHSGGNHSHVCSATRNIAVYCTNATV